MEQTQVGECPVAANAPKSSRLRNLGSEQCPSQPGWFAHLACGAIKSHFQVKTVTCKLPRTMLPVVVGEDGKIVTDIARDAKVKVTLVKGGPHEESALFHLVGSAEAVKTAQYMMQIKIKERLAKGEGGIRYNR